MAGLGIVDRRLADDTSGHSTRDLSQPTHTARPLRDHQVSALTLLRRSLASGKLAPMLAAPTGAGKTRIAAEIVLGALAKGKRVLIVVPALDLVDQTVAALENEGIFDVGVMQGTHVRTDCTAPVQVASVQTLQRRKMPFCDIILIDEAHRWYAYFERMIGEANAHGVPVVGLSATPWTKGLGKHFDDLLSVTSTQALIDAGYLSPFRVFAPSHPDLKGVRTIAGDFHEGELSEAMNKPDLVADVVSTWLRRGEGRPTLCFGVDRAHAKELQAQFTAVGVPTGYIDAYSTREERARVRHLFHTGEIKIVCNVACLTTGVDWDVRCIILARPTQSEMLFVQIVGRGLRTGVGKTDCLVLDHSDTHLRLGFVTDIRHSKLDTGTKAHKLRRPAALLPKECPSCQFLKAPKMRTCPQCGFTPAPQADVQVGEGELVEFAASQARRAQQSIERKASVFGQLQAIARRHGYAKGWASHRFKAFFGVWPNAVGGAPPVEPEADILSWVRSRQIAFAKGRERPNAVA